VAQEIRSGTALTVLAKPVNRSTFLLGKFAGLAGVLALLTAHNLVASLLASRIAFDAYGEVDKTAVALYFGATLGAYLLGGFFNYFLRRPFVSDAVWAVVGLSALAVIWIVKFTTTERVFETAQTVDWRLVPAALLILFALWVLAALALACSTRLDIIPTLAICSTFFMLGLVSDYFFGRPAAEGVLWAKVLYAVTPNWSQFWVADALEGTKTAAAIWQYVPKAAIYLVTSLATWLAAALVFFEERELN
jgi:ABC-type transport system involved in multi-copper enzyme maturation permease subunit